MIPLFSEGGSTGTHYGDEAFVSALYKADGEPSARDVASIVGCSPSTAHRRLRELVNQGAVIAENDDSPVTYTPGEFIPSVRTSELSPSWRSAPKRWGNSLHTLSPYIGGFPPALPAYFIRRFSEPGDVVYDPFSGGGTTPLEATLHNRVGWASDSFEYATTLTRAKCDPMATPEFTTYLDSKLDDASEIDTPLEELVAGHDELSLDDLLVFYSEHTLGKLARLREVLRGDDSREATYLRAIVCGILHGPSEMFLSLSTRDTFSGSIDYVKEYAEDHDLERPNRDIRPSALRKQELVTKDFDALPDNRETRVEQADARDTCLPANSVDLVVTSPPYMRVLDYSWNNWLRLWWLGVDRSTEREDLTLTSDESTYRTFVANTLQELERLLTDDGYAIIVVGDVRKRYSDRIEYINTAQLFAEEALKHTDLLPRQIIDDEYDLQHRNYARANRLKYGYDIDDKAEEAASKLDRCLILSPHKDTLPPASNVTVPWAEE
ncbi:DNA methyltransferase [Halarchaeum sp. P4]|uniref:DNA methyltransferase n=1 Tax=Halarchaeum sp. P4 TaxID=3421639 RepID=UPI003EBC43F3